MKRTATLGMWHLTDAERWCFFCDVPVTRTDPSTSPEFRSWVCRKCKRIYSDRMTDLAETEKRRRRKQRKEQKEQAA